MCACEYDKLWIAIFLLICLNIYIGIRCIVVSFDDSMLGSESVSNSWLNGLGNSNNNANRSLHANDISASASASASSFTHRRSRSAPPRNREQQVEVPSQTANKHNHEGSRGSLNASAVMSSLIHGPANPASRSDLTNSNNNNNNSLSSVRSSTDSIRSSNNNNNNTNNGNSLLKWTSKSLAEFIDSRSGSQQQPGNKGFSATSVSAPNSVSSSNRRLTLRKGNAQSMKREAPFALNYG